MTQPVSNCPNCGAKIVFQWSSSVQTVCTYCKTILVRTDVDLKKVGQVADLPPDSSPIQLNTEGMCHNKAFVVGGRILYEYEQGGWNEWHIVFNDGSSGWLSDAQLEYDLSWLSKPPQPLPPNTRKGQVFDWQGKNYQVTSVTKAHYKGVQGELPFEYWDKSDLVFADLRTTTGDLGTIDYSENPPLLFLGR